MLLFTKDYPILTDQVLYIVQSSYQIGIVNHMKSDYQLYINCLLQQMSFHLLYLFSDLEFKIKRQYSIC